MVMCYSDKQYLCNKCCSFHFNETHNYIGVSVTLVIFIYQCKLTCFLSPLLQFRVITIYKDNLSELYTYI